jgi:hypothetical protein
MRTCSVDGCTKKHEAKGYCDKHYQKYIKYGDPLGRHEYMKYSLSCSVKNCDKPYYALGYCQKHYERNMRYGDPLHTEIEMHGRSNTSEYKTWIRMIQRCYDKKSRSYYRYGGRGISVCKEWMDSFEAFYSYMGDRPFKDAQIDRIDNDGDYKPGNCRWASLKDNIRNSSSTKLSIDDVKIIRKIDLSTTEKIKEAAIKYKISTTSIYDIISRRTWKDVV